MDYIVVTLLAIAAATFIIYILANKVFGVRLRLKSLFLCAACSLFISIVLPRIIFNFAGLPGTVAFLAGTAILFAYLIAYYDDARDLRLPAEDLLSARALQQESLSQLVADSLAADEKGDKDDTADFPLGSVARPPECREQPEVLPVATIIVADAEKGPEPGGLTEAVAAADVQESAAEEPVEEEPATEEPVVEEPVVEEPATEEPAAEEPAAEEPVVEEPVVEEPATEEPATEEPAAEEPVVEEPVAEEPAAEEPAAEEPAAEEPAAEEPAAEEPVVEEPVVEEPAAEEPAAEEPVAEEPAAEEPVAEEPAAEEPAAEEPVAEEPVAEEPAAEEPAAEEQEEQVITDLSASPVSNSLDDLLDYAFGQKELRNYNQALTGFRLALKQYRDSDAAPYLAIEIANLLKNKGSYDEAIRVLSESRTLPGLQKNQILAQELVAMIAYLRIAKNMLLQHRAGLIAYNLIPAEIVEKIEAEFREWRNLE